MVACFDLEQIKCPEEKFRQNFKMEEKNLDGSWESK